MKIGYIRISNKDESSLKQIAALAMENCDRAVEEESLYAAKEHPELKRLLGEMNGGDTLVVWGVGRRGLNQAVCWSSPAITGASRANCAGGAQPRVSSRNLALAMLTSRGQIVPLRPQILRSRLDPTHRRRHRPDVSR